MSEVLSAPVSALPGAKHNGLVLVEELGLKGMITVRGDLSSTNVKNAVTGVTGVDMPGQRQANVLEDNGIAWMSPDELLVMVPYGEVADKIAAIGTALGDEHHLAVNVSDARAVFRLSGAGVRDVMAKLAPVDLAKGSFGPGDFRRTRIAQIPAAFWMPDDQSIQIVCFRSVAAYAFGILKDAASAGSEVGFH